MNRQGAIRWDDSSVEVGFSMKGAVSGATAGGYIGTKALGPAGTIPGILIGGTLGAFLGPED